MNCYAFSKCVVLAVLITATYSTGSLTSKLLFKELVGTKYVGRCSVNCRNPRPDAFHRGRCQCGGIYTGRNLYTAEFELDESGKICCKITADFVQGQGAFALELDNVTHIDIKVEDIPNAWVDETVMHENALRILRALRNKKKCSANVYYGSTSAVDWCNEGGGPLQARLRKLVGKHNGVTFNHEKRTLVSCKLNDDQDLSLVSCKLKCIYCIGQCSDNCGNPGPHARHRGRCQCGIGNYTDEESGRCSRNCSNPGPHASRPGRCQCGRGHYTSDAGRCSLNCRNPSPSPHPRRRGRCQCGGDYTEQQCRKCDGSRCISVTLKDLRVPKTQELIFYSPKEWGIWFQEPYQKEQFSIFSKTWETLLSKRQKRNERQTFQNVGLSLNDRILLQAAKDAKNQFTNG